MSRPAPMLASVGRALPTGEGWVFEPKYDGIRVLAFADPTAVALVSRNGLVKTRQFPEIAEALRDRAGSVGRPFVLDGEIVALDGSKPARFQQLQRRMHVTDRSAIAAHRRTTPVALMAFDLLLDGKRSLVAEPWRVRRRHLAALLHPPDRKGVLRLSDVSEDGEAMLQRARERGDEGIMAKRADAPYAMGRRSRDWLKLKIERQQEFVIGGWTEPRPSREHIGAILLGIHDDKGRLVYAGHTGSGFTRASLREVYERLAPLEQPNSPFVTTPRTNETAHWVHPSVVAEIKFNEWTSDGRLRQPVFLGLRDDKDAREVVREPDSIPSATSETSKKKRGSTRRATRSAASVERPARKRGNPRRTKLPSRTVHAIVDRIAAIETDNGNGTLTLPDGVLELTNLGTVFFPKTGTTKGDLLRYYARVSPVLLPAIADRPLVMKRFPNGVTGKAFYQQRAPESVPEGVRVECVSDEGMTTQRRIIGGNLATLLYVAQLGAISIDPWHSRVQSIPFADYSVIDLDPGPRATFARVVDVALAVKEVLDELGLRGIAKTSGASGLHVVLPLPERVPNEAARMLAELVATRVADRHPRIATVTRSVADRPRATVYVDYLQNIRGKTVAGVYSVRAQERPYVSAPLMWDEVERGLDPTAFTIDTMPSRIADVGDLWARAMRRPNRLDQVLDRE